MKNATREAWVQRLDLRPHPEGGHYAETHRSHRRTQPAGSNQARSPCTSIHYLLGSTAAGEYSAWHRLQGMEESWYFHYGSPLTLHTLSESGTLKSWRLGWDPGCRLDVHLPADIWFCAAVENEDPEAYALVSCAVQPGFEFSGFEMGERRALQRAFPQHAELIDRYCR